MIQHKYSISSIVYPSLNSNLDGISVDIFFCGCHFKCPGCHNPQLQEFKESNYTSHEIISVVNIAKNATVVTLMGGEPLDQPYMLGLLKKLKENCNKKIAIYTGYAFDVVAEELLEIADYVKTGQYLEDEKTPFGRFLSSKNQVMHKKVGSSSRCAIWEKQWEYKEVENE